MRNKREIYDMEIPSRAVIVYLYLYDRADKEGKCFPSHKRIATDLNISPNTVKRALNDLVYVGFVTKENRVRNNGGKSSNMYFIVWKIAVKKQKDFHTGEVCPKLSELWYRSLWAMKKLISLTVSNWKERY